MHEVRRVIHFLCANQVPLNKIHHKLKETYGESTMTIQQVHRWCVELKKGRTDLGDQPCSGRPTV